MRNEPVHRSDLWSHASSGYWSATTFAGNPGRAWGVGFTDGFVGYFNKFVDYYVRAVRGGL